MHGIWKGKCESVAIFISHLGRLVAGHETVLQLKALAHISPGLPCPCEDAAVLVDSLALT